MAAYQQNNPPYGEQDFDQQHQEQYDPNQQDVPDNASPAQGAPPASSAAARKKRNYAGQAYDFGAGANSALGGQQLGGGQYPAPPAAGYGGYGQQAQQSSQQGAYPGPIYGSNPASPGAHGPPGYGQQPAAVGGYQAPEPGYPGPGAPPGQSGIGGLTQGMGNLAMGTHGQQQPQQMHMQGRPPMNQLFPTDLLNQPLNVAELDKPPPSIILPPNVSREYPEQINIY